jgi:hypothetical protein
MAERVSMLRKGRGIGFFSASLRASRDSASALTSKFYYVLFVSTIDRKHRHVGECRGHEMGPKPLPQLPTIILSSFLDSSPCMAFDYFDYFELRLLRVKGAWPWAIQLRMFSSACVSLYQVPFLLRPLFIHRTVFQITGNETTLVLKSHQQQDCDLLILAGLLISHFRESV